MYSFAVAALHEGTHTGGCAVNSHGKAGTQARVPAQTSQCTGRQTHEQAAASSKEAAQISTSPAVCVEERVAPLAATAACLRQAVHRRVMTVE